MTTVNKDLFSAEKKSEKNDLEKMKKRAKSFKDLS